MAALFRVFWQIVLLRKGPQVLPASRELLWLLLITDGLLDAVLLVVKGYTFGLALLSSLVDILIMVAVVHGLLIIHRHRQRIFQTLSALAGCGILLGLLTLFLLLLLNMGGVLRDLVAVLWLLLIGWSVTVVAHIFRHALGVTLGMGFLFAIGYLIVFYSLSSFLVPLEASV